MKFPVCHGLRNGYDRRVRDRRIHIEKERARILYETKKKEKLQNIYLRHRRTGTREDKIANYGGSVSLITIIIHDEYNC